MDGHEHSNQQGEHMTRVTHIREPHDIYIGRPRAGQPWNFGNPFIVGTHGARGECIELFRDWLTTGNDHGARDATPERRQWILDHIHELEDKRLGCFCKPQPCHGDVLLELLEEQIRVEYGWE